MRQGFAGMIMDVAGREYPKVVATLGLVGINPTELGSGCRQASSPAYMACFRRSPGTPHPVRQAFDELIAALRIGRLAHDDAFRARVDRAKRVSGSSRGGRISQGFVGRRAGLDEPRHATPPTPVCGDVWHLPSLPWAPVCRQRNAPQSFNEHLARTVEALAPELRDGLAGHIASTVKAWNDDGPGAGDRGQRRS